MDNLKVNVVLAGGNKPNLSTETLVESNIDLTEFIDSNKEGF